jgi:hypothetical protein
VQPFTDSGVPLIADFAVESYGEELSVVLESAGGKVARQDRSRNADYVPALRVLLGRLAERGAEINSAFVDSSRVANDPLSGRMLIDAPIQLGPSTDLGDLQGMLTRNQRRVGATDDGNRRKRIRLVVAVPGYGRDDQSRLAAELAGRGLTVSRLMEELGSLDVEPIRILWAIGRLAAGGGPLFALRDWRREVEELLRDFSAAVSEHALWRLDGDSAIWQTRGSTETDAQVGFTAAAAALLANPVVRAEAIYVLRTELLSEIVDHAGLLERVGLAGKAEQAMIEIRTAFDSFTETTLPSLPPDTLDKMTAAVRRVEQAELRKLVVGSADTAECALCGDEFPLRYLVAAHIKPRSQCTDEERRDLRNVAMAACSFGCDMLFELGYITVDEDGWIRTAEAVPSGRFADHVNTLATRRCSAHRPETEPYFAWHRANRFDKTTTAVCE